MGAYSTSAWMDLWAQPIRLDPKWNNGDYYGKEAPLDGLKAALKIVTLQANGWEWARKTFGIAPAQRGKDPAKAFANDFKINAFLDQAAVARVAFADANHFLYLGYGFQCAKIFTGRPLAIHASRALKVAPVSRHGARDPAESSDAFGHVRAPGLVAGPARRIPDLR